MNLVHMMFLMMFLWPLGYMKVVRVPFYIPLVVTGGVLSVLARRKVVGVREYIFFTLLLVLAGIQAISFEYTTGILKMTALGIVSLSVSLIISWYLKKTRRRICCELYLTRLRLQCI